MVRVKGKVKAKVKRKGVKAGSQNKGGDGGIFIDKVIKIGVEIKKNKNG